VQTALVDVDPATAAAKNDAIAAAREQAAVSGEPVHLHRARARRHRRVAAIIAVAAALLIAVPLLAIAFTGSGSEQKSGTTADETAAGIPSQTAAPGANADGTQTPPYVGDLGGLETEAQVRSAVAARSAETQAAETQAADRSASPQLASPVPTVAADDSTGSNAGPADQARSCASALVATEPALGTLELTASATWQGAPAVVAVYRGASEVIVILRGDCTVVTRVAP
jgi:hypothetical protein